MLVPGRDLHSRCAGRAEHGEKMVLQCMHTWFGLGLRRIRLHCTRDPHLTSARLRTGNLCLLASKSSRNLDGTGQRLHEMMQASNSTTTTVSRAIAALSGEQALQRETCAPGCPVLTVPSELVRR